MLDVGYIDLQVNGFAGVDFNADGLTADQLHLACRRLRDDGAAAFLPTVITAEIETMVSRLSRLVELRQADPLAKAMIPGLHIEGPFISGTPGYVGAHPAWAVRVANRDDAERLLAACDGLARIVTLAPEHDANCRVTRFLADQGIVVAGGHCDPGIDQLRASMDAGLTMFTHLGNGCPMHLRRHDNIIQRVLSLADRLVCSFIADGAHVPFAALGNYLHVAGVDRCVIVSDAISATGLGPGRYSIGGQPAMVGEDGVPRPPGDGSHFVGSATSVARMADNLQRELSFSNADIELLTRTVPAQILNDS